MSEYKALANAIIEQAARDFRVARKKLARDPHNQSAHRTVRDIEAFFRSDWFGLLTTLAGKHLLNMLKEESE